MKDRSRPRARIADVARLAGVSKTAVSFAFNSPHRLSPETASRIRNVAESLGYRPHPVARMLTQGQTMSLGVLTPQPLSVIFANPFFGAFSAGVARAAEESGYALHFVSPLHGSLARAVSRATVDGLVAIGLTADHPEFEQVRAAGLPIVLVDSTAMPERPSVGVDDEGGARAATDHLIELGHRDFLIVAIHPAATGRAGEPDSVGARRMRGYRSGFEAHGISFPDQTVIGVPSTIEGGIGGFRQRWHDGARPTAVLAMSDVIAIGVLRAARTIGLGVPGDLSIVGYDDLDIAQHTDPPLTTVHQPVRRKGEEAIRLLLSLIQRQESQSPEQRRLETHLVVRGSSGPVPQSRRELKRRGRNREGAPD